MKEEVKIIIEKYTGKIIDDIPDRFVDGQTLEIRKLKRFIKSCSLLDNPCDKHTDFVGEVCPVCLQELMENLECCGNCKSFLRENCPKKEQIDEFQTEFPEPNSVCDSWNYDEKTREERK